MSLNFSAGKFSLASSTGLLFKPVLCSEGLDHAGTQELHGELSSNNNTFCELSFQIFGPFFFIWQSTFSLSCKNVYSIQVLCKICILQILQTTTKTSSYVTCPVVYLMMFSSRKL